MAKFFCSLGKIDKTLLLPLIYILLYTLINIYWEDYPYNVVAFTLEYFGTSIGQILTFFVGFIFNYLKFYKTKKKEPEKNYFRNYSIMFFIDVFYVLSSVLSFFSGNDGEDELSRKIYINDAIEIVVLTIVTHFILRYKYYIHHIICITLIVILAIIIDYELDNFLNINTITLLNSAFYILFDSFIYSYFKYLIEIKYYYFMTVLFIYGIMNLILYIISFSIIWAVQGTNTLMFQFYDFYNEHGIGHIIFRFLFGLIFTGFFVGIIEFMILDKLTPNYVIISFAMGRIPSSLIKSKGINKLIILIVSIIQIFCLLFYLEIFECNFCSLNKNTKRNISLRGESLSFVVNEDDISYKGYYLPEMTRHQENELDEITEKNEE